MISLHSKLWKTIFFGCVIAGLLVPIPSFCQGKEKLQKGTKLVGLVIAPEKFRDEELFVPEEALKKAGFNTVIVSTKAGKAVGMLDGQAIAEKTLDEVKDSDLSGLIVVGGLGSRDFLWEHLGLRTLVQNLVKSGKPVAAICLSPVVLAKAGVLKGKKATVYKDEKAIEELKKNGARFEDTPVVVDGKIVTGNGPNAAKDFAEEFIKLMK